MSLVTAMKNATLVTCVDSIPRCSRGYPDWDPIAIKFYTGCQVDTHVQCQCIPAPEGDRECMPLASKIREKSQKRKVVKVVRGDLITVAVSVHITKEKATKESLQIIWPSEGEMDVRLYGILIEDSLYAADAKQFVLNLVENKAVKISFIGLDRKRTGFGIVTLPNGKVLNHELVRSGLARWHKKWAPGDRILEAMEEKAKSEKKGLWQKVSSPSSSQKPEPVSQ